MFKGSGIRKIRQGYMRGRIKRILPFWFSRPAPALLLLFFLFLLSLNMAWGEINDNLAIRAIIGEASNQGYQGMLAVAVGIRNRDTLQGIYGLKALHINKEPQWVWDMAKKAWQESKYNRIHSGTHWESTDFKIPKWSFNMKEVYRYKKHIFYKCK